MGVWHQLKSCWASSKTIESAYFRKVQGARLILQHPGKALNLSASPSFGLCLEHISAPTNLCTAAETVNKWQPPRLPRRTLHRLGVAFSCSPFRPRDAGRPVDATERPIRKQNLGKALKLGLFFFRRLGMQHVRYTFLDWSDLAALDVARQPYSWNYTCIFSK